MVRTCSMIELTGLCDLHGQTNVGSARMRALWRYHSCSKAKMPRPTNKTHASQRQNWLLPARVKSNSSTPLFAKMRHMPERIPENEAYDIATSSCLRLSECSVASLADDSIVLDLESCRRGVRSVAAAPAAWSSGASAVREAGPLVCGRSMVLEDGVSTSEPSSSSSWVSSANLLLRVNSVMWV